MSLALAVPLLLLLAACLVVVGPDRSLYERSKLAAYPIGAAFVGSIAILFIVVARGPITIRFYDPASIAAAPCLSTSIDRARPPVSSVASVNGTDCV